MEFLNKCALRLETESADSIMTDMRSHYTTVRCLRVKTGIVRKFYNGPDSEEFVSELGKIMEEYKHDSERLQWIHSITDREDGKGPWYGIKSLKDSTYPEIAEKLAKLPRRLPTNVWNLSITKSEIKECKKLATNVKMKVNSRRLKVEGLTLLRHCRNVIDNCEKFTMYELALAIIFLTGRRTCEIMNGKSVFSVFDMFDNNEPIFNCSFEGQAKKRNSVVYCIPILYEYTKINKALERLRNLQGVIPATNDKVTSRYASGLRQFLLASSIFSQCLKIHNLRKTYACLCLKLFDWGEPSDLYICMHILGHNDIAEPIVYNVIDVGNIDSESKLGNGPSIPQFGS